MGDHCIGVGGRCPPRPVVQRRCVRSSCGPMWWASAPTKRVQTAPARNIGRRLMPPPVILQCLAEFASADANKIKSIFGGGVYVAENSSRPANVRVRDFDAHVVRCSRPQPAQTTAQRSGCRLKLLRSGTPCRCISSTSARCRRHFGGPNL